MPDGDRGGGTVAQPRAPDVGAVRRRGAMQDGCAGRGLGHHPWMSPATMPAKTRSRTIAMIGLRSIGPSGGMYRRKIPMYGSHTSRRKPSTALDQRAYGTRPPDAENIELRMEAVVRGAETFATAPTEA